MTEDRVPTPEPLNTILQAIVQHATDSGMSFDNLRVLNRLIEKVEQAAEQPGPPLLIDVGRLQVDSRCGCVLIKRPHTLRDHWQPES